MADKANQNSVLILPTDEKVIDEWSKKIDQKRKDLLEDQSERKKIYAIRNDFFIGNQNKYTNIVGLEQKEKKGHANAVINYAGKTAIKIAYGLSNNPPKLDFPIDSDYEPDDPDYDTEENRTQAVENFVFTIFKRNQFWLRGYRRGVFNQVKVGDYAIKVYPQNVGTLDSPEWEIKIVNHEKLENLLVGWRGDDSRAFDFVIAEEKRSKQSVEEEYGITLDEEDLLEGDSDTSGSGSSFENNNQWGTRNIGASSSPILPSGRNSLPSVKVIEYDDENVYAIKIGKKVRQLILKDGVNMPKKFKLWVIGENIPNPGSHWSMSDIDALIDPQIELNEASNEERDYIRVGANQKYVAYNMEDFNAESIKTGSGGVISISSPDGTAKFEPLQTNVNTYPADTFLQRMKKHIHDLGVPEVSFGTSGGDSGRSKAIDYQTIVDLINFKQDSWELSITEVCEKVQILGDFYFGREDAISNPEAQAVDFFQDAKTGEFKYRYPDFNWADMVPITQSDKIVNIVNKVQMGLPLKIAYKELGYRDVDAVLAEMKKEAQDKDLMAYRSKMWALTPGVAEAQAEIAAKNPPPQQPTNIPKVNVQVKADAATAQGQQILKDINLIPEADPNAPVAAAPAPSGTTPPQTANEQAAGPTLTSNQNSSDAPALPMAQEGGTTSFSSGKGLIDQTKQNLGNQGK